MSEMQETAPRRESTDFSIARILSKDVASAPSSTSGSVVKESLIAPGLTCTSILQQGAEFQAPSSFFLQNKLDWLRSFCEMQPEKSKCEDSNATIAGDIVNSTETVTQAVSSDPVQFNGEELSWLRCTRYRPPKLPRKSCAGKNVKRKPGPHPRIPFTKYQLEVLEEKYKTNAYLSRKDVIHLSNLLHLPQSRIKIWFQNRRARERRESQMHEQTEINKI